MSRSVSEENDKEKVKNEDEENKEKVQNRDEAGKVEVKNENEDDKERVKVKDEKDKEEVKDKDEEGKEEVKDKDEDSKEEVKGESGPRLVQLYCFLTEVPILVSSILAKPTKNSLFIFFISAGVKTFFKTRKPNVLKKYTCCSVIIIFIFLILD